MKRDELDKLIRDFLQNLNVEQKKRALHQAYDSGSEQDEQEIQIEESKIAPIKKKRKQEQTQPNTNKVKQKIVQIYAAPDLKGKIIISQMFSGMEFYIVNCRDDPTKTDLELMIHQHGGILV